MDCCWDILLSQQMLLLLNVSLMIIIFSARQCTGALNQYNIQLLQRSLTLNFLPLNWPRKSPLTTRFRHTQQYNVAYELQAIRLKKLSQ